MARMRRHPGARPKMELEKQARSLLGKARKILTDKSLEDNAREHKYCDVMQLYCTMMAELDPIGRWHTTAQEWSKRKQVAGKAIADDKLDFILKQIEGFRNAGDLLDKLE